MTTSSRVVPPFVVMPLLGEVWSADRVVSITRSARVADSPVEAEEFTHGWLSGSASRASQGATVISDGDAADRMRNGRRSLSYQPERCLASRNRARPSTSSPTWPSASVRLVRPSTWPPIGRPCSRGDTVSQKGRPAHREGRTGSTS
jgi:hypothetical protein